MKWLLDRLPDEWGFRLIVAICFLSAFAIMAVVTLVVYNTSDSYTEFLLYMHIIGDAIHRLG